MSERQRAQDEEPSARETPGARPAELAPTPDDTAADRPDPGQMEFGRIVAERDRELDAAKKR